MKSRKGWLPNPSKYFREEKKNIKTYRTKMLYLTTKLKQHYGIEIRKINTANSTV
jgi:hypothetical protein